MSSGYCEIVIGLMEPEHGEREKSLVNKIPASHDVK